MGNLQPGRKTQEDIDQAFLDAVANGQSKKAIGMLSPNFMEGFLNVLRNHDSQVAQLDATDGKQNNAVQIALQNGHERLAIKLADKVQHGDPEMGESSRIVDINGTNHDGEDALAIAMRTSSNDAAKRLLDHVNLEIKPRHLIAAIEHEVSAPVWQKLLDQQSKAIDSGESVITPDVVIASRLKKDESPSSQVPYKAIQSLYERTSNHQSRLEEALEKRFGPPLSSGDMNEKFSELVSEHREACQYSQETPKSTCSPGQ